jgi:hypothetical protein
VPEQPAMSYARYIFEIALFNSFLFKSFEQNDTDLKTVNIFISDVQNIQSIYQGHRSYIHGFDPLDADWKL